MQEVEEHPHQDFALLSHRKPMKETRERLRRSGLFRLEPQGAGGAVRVAWIRDDT
jgi:hypothetical protein